MSSKKPSKKKGHNKAYATIGIISIIILAVAFLQVTGRIDLSGLFIRQDGNDGDHNGDGNNGNNTYTDIVAPTSLTAMVSPNPARMGGAVYGTAISNGRNFPITIYAKHKGENTQTTMAGLLGSDGKFDLITQLNTPGYWLFWVTAGSVKSNEVSLTCEGIMITSDRDTYSKTFLDSITFKVYSNFKGNAAIVAYDPSGATIPITNTVINNGGYGVASVSLDFLPNGNYEFDVLIAGQKAKDYAGSFWIRVSR
jgi:hypothetical protein